MSTLQQVQGLMEQAIVESYNEAERNDAAVLAHVRALLQQMLSLMSGDGGTGSTLS